jgi:hypothetical protein
MDIEKGDIIGSFTWKTEEDVTSVIWQVDPDGVFINWPGVERLATDQRNAQCLMMLAIRDGKWKSIGVTQ